VDGAFDRLVYLIRHGLEEERRSGDPIHDYELQVSVKNKNVSIGLKFGEDDFIPGVAIHADNQNRSLDELAQGLLDDLAKRALAVGRLRSERPPR
jgi:hypothetical protein